MKLHKNNIQQFSFAIKSSWENQFHFSIKRRGVENQSKKRKQKAQTPKTKRNEKMINFIMMMMAMRAIMMMMMGMMMLSEVE